MKKILFMATCLMTLVACNDKKIPVSITDTSKTDSLQRIIEQKDNEINDMMAVFNDIEEGFRHINEAEGRINVVKESETTNKHEIIKENIQQIHESMSLNRKLISKLRQQLRESSVKSDQMKRTIENMVKQLEEKDTQLKELRAQLDEKDIHITELDQAISSLSADVANLKTESAQKSETISTQDKQLNTAWVVFGTKKELREQNILVKGKVLQGNFNKDYFKKIDIRVEKEIKLYSKSAEILTMHPANTYTLTQDAQKQYVLRITNPQAFWSTSKYLVVRVK